MDLFALATVPSGPDEAGGPPPTKFYELRDNLSGTRRSYKAGPRISNLGTDAVTQFVAERRVAWVALGDCF